MLALEHGPDNRKDRNQNGSFFKGYQAAAHRRADAVGSIICTDIPADIGSGSQQYDEYQFDGRLTSVYPTQSERKAKKQLIGESIARIHKFGSKSDFYKNLRPISQNNNSHNIYDKK
jgi:hypothetical protein